MTTSSRPAREAAGERSSIAPLFAPRTIAVIGASRRPDSIGHEIVHNLVADGFSGAVFPVNPKANSVCSIRSYPSVADLPDALDVAVIVVPKERVIDVAEECGAIGVTACVWSGQTAWASSTPTRPSR
jgi:acyl-CoA synthetase (NDP forming)